MGDGGFLSAARPKTRTGKRGAELHRDTMLCGLKEEGEAFVPLLREAQAQTIRAGLVLIATKLASGYGMRQGQSSWASSFAIPV